MCNDGEEGLFEVVFGWYYDFILLDVMMLKMDGFDVLKKFCVSYSMFVFMLIVRGDDYDCILGLEMGVDDYLLKLFNYCELVVWIKVIVCCYNFFLMGGVVE